MRPIAPLLDSLPNAIIDKIDVATALGMTLSQGPNAQRRYMVEATEILKQGELSGLLVRFGSVYALAESPMARILMRGAD